MSSKRYEPLLDDGAGGEKRSIARCLLPVTLVLGALCVAAVIAIPILLTSTSVSAPPRSISFAPIAPVAASNERFVVRCCWCLVWRALFSLALPPGDALFLLLVIFSTSGAGVPLLDGPALSLIVLSR